MNQNVQVWMPPILALFGSLIVLMFAAWLNTKVVTSQIDALRAEMKQGFAELELRLTNQISNLAHHVERLEEQRSLIRP